MMRCRVLPTRSFLPKFRTPPPPLYVSLVSTTTRHYCSADPADGTYPTEIEPIGISNIGFDIAPLVSVLRQLRDHFDIDSPDSSPDKALVKYNASGVDSFEKFINLPMAMETGKRKIALIPGGKGTGRTTLLHTLTRHFDRRRWPSDGHYRDEDDEYEKTHHAKSLYLSDAIAYDATDPRLSFGDSSFIKLQYRVLHAATGAPPHAFGTTVLELRRRLGLAAWFAFPNDVLFAAVREALAMYNRDYLLVAVDDVHVPAGPQEGRYPICLPPTVDLSFSQKQCPNNTTNTIEDLQRLRFTLGKDGHKQKNKGIRWESGNSAIIIGVTTSQFLHGNGKKVHLVTVLPPDPNPQIKAALHFLRLSFNSHRASEVRYMLRHAAVHARFLADTYHQICGGGLTSVADFDAQFNAFVSPRIDQFLAYCHEKHLDPKRLFDDIFLARPGSNIIDPLTVAADSIVLCRLVMVGTSHDPQTLYIHPEVLVMLHRAVYISGDSGRDPSATPPPHSTMLSILLALARRDNAFYALTTEAAQSSPAQCTLNLRSDVALLTLTAFLARAADESRFFPPKYRLAYLFPSSQHHVSEEALKDAMLRCMDPAHPSYADMLALHTLAQGDGPLYVEGMPRAVYSFPRFDDACGLLADPSAAPALLRSMAAHGLIRGALYGLDVRWDSHRQVHGLLTFGLQAIGAGPTMRTAAAIAEHRARRSVWAKAFSTSELKENASSGEKSATVCGLLDTNVFVHVFVVEDSVRELHTAKPFFIGDVRCFEVMISVAELQNQWPMAARIGLTEEDCSDSFSENFFEEHPDVDL